MAEMNCDLMGALSDWGINIESTLEEEKSATKVMVVDPDNTMCRLMAVILENEHFPTTLCSSGKEALEKAKQETFGLIITNIDLGDFNGMWLLKAVKIINPTTEVIVVASAPSVENAVSAMRLGAADYLTIPFGMGKLRQTIKRAAMIRILKRKWRTEKQQMTVPPLDEETGLFSNYSYHILLTNELSHSSHHNLPCALLLIRIEGLSAAVDSEKGNSADGKGEGFMKELAWIFRSSCRNTDIIARYSYDEFAIILPATVESGIQPVAQRIMNKLARFNAELTQLGQEFSLQPILGGASFPMSAKTKEQLLKVANENMLKNSCTSQEIPSTGEVEGEGKKAEAQVVLRPQRRRTHCYPK
jgi:diguanylate cyclase (GGDEF)-like protein